MIGDVRLFAPTASNGHIARTHAFLREAARNGEPVWAEVFKLSHAPVEDALRAVGASGGLTVVADGAQSYPAFANMGALDGANRIAAYSARGGDPARASFVQHAKGWATRDQLLMTTSSPNGSGTLQIDASMLLGADAAEAFRGVVTTGTSGTREARIAALELARSRGVVYNDPQTGVRHLDDAMLAIIRGAQRELHVMPKEFLAPSWADEIVAAKQRGVDVKVTTRQIDAVSRRRLRDAGIPVKPVPLSAPPGAWRFPAAEELTWRRMHFNAVSGDGGERIAVGTRYFWEPTAPGERTAREIGVVLGGDDGRLLEQHLVEQLGARASVRDVAGLLRRRA